MRALGANPTPLAYGEVFSALQTHLIDGAENNCAASIPAASSRPRSYWSQSEHSYAPDVLLMSRRSFDALAAADRERCCATWRAASVPVMRAAVGRVAKRRARGRARRRRAR